MKKKTTQKEEEKKIKYTSYCFRLNKETYESMVEDRLKSGLSWNRYLVALLNNK